MESAPTPSQVDDGLVFLPRASPALELLCVTLYLTLALVAACRALSQESTFYRSQRSTFQRLMVLFALTRAASFVDQSVARNLLNRASLCLFFSLVLFQTVLWIDIANPKISTRSRRIWIGFLVANGLFYATILGLSVLHEVRVAQAKYTMTRIDQSTLWTGVLPVLLIAAGSLINSLGLVYSTCKMRNRVERLLKPSGFVFRRRLDEHVEMKLTRALRFTTVVMGVCSVLFLLRTIIYVQRPFSHQGCGDIHSPDVCVIVGYAIPEIVPCVLFLVLMWEVEPTLEFPSRRSLSFSNGRVTSETTPLLDSDTFPLDKTKNDFDDVKEAANQVIALPNARPAVQSGYLASGRRPSPLSLGLGDSVLARARRRLEHVMRQHLGGISEEQQPFDRYSRIDSTSSADSQAGIHEYDRFSQQVTFADDSHQNDSRRHARSDSSPRRAWLSFQCFNLTLPSKSSIKSSSFVVLHLVEAETGKVLAKIGQTEISFSKDPCFHMMLPVDMRVHDLLRVSVYSVRNPNSLDDLNSQWLVGDPHVPLSSFMDGSAPAIGQAAIFSLYSPLSRTRSSGEIVIRCEAEVKGLHAGMSSDGLERITRSFMYVGTESTDAEDGAVQDDSTYSEIALQIISLASTSQRTQGKILVEEELIESVYTWEVPYQLLQLILSDLLMKLNQLKREIAFEEGDKSLDPTLSSQLCNSNQPVPSGKPFSPVQEDGTSHTYQSLEGSEELMLAASETSPSLSLENRNRPVASIGMLSEMIIHIQDDAVERKKRKWRLDLVKTMEQYISEVEDSILRYGATQHAGLTFKPSTMKADADLRFLALNLHQQLMTVGNAAPTSENDVQYGDPTSAVRYARLVNSFVGTHVLSPSQQSRDSSILGQPTDLDSVLFMDDDINDEKEVIPSSPSDESPVEPVEALRRRMISFDSAETIVSKSAAGQNIGIPSEQRKLAETIVAMGITEDEFQSIYGLDDNVDACTASDVVANTVVSELDHENLDVTFPSTVGSLWPNGVETKKPLRAIDTNAEGRPPFYKHRMYGTTTVGAFTAHVYGFRSGGVRQMREELEKLQARLVKAAQASSDLTMDALERKYNELKWHIERRLEVAFCQAMSALVTCFQQTLYVHTHDNRPHPLKASGIEYLEMLTRVGFLFSVESLLSTYGNELGMLGDTEAAVKELGRVQIKLRPVKSPRAATFRVSITSGSSGFVIELPIITRRASEFPDRSMHRVPGQDAVSGAIYLSLLTPEQRMRAKFLFQKPIRVIPVIFSQGLNEMQTVANTVGKASLQKDINAENMGKLEAYVKSFAEWVTKKQVRDVALTPIYDADDLDRIQTSLVALKVSIQLSGRSKRMSILSLSSSIARCVGGGRVTMCKSAKDRTSMSITLEEAKLLVHAHGLLADDMDAFTDLLRTYGVRRENARKNIGKAQYCFSALQNYMLPQDYQCPPGTGGGSRAYS